MRFFEPEVMDGRMKQNTDKINYMLLSMVNVVFFIFASFMPLKIQQ